MIRCKVLTADMPTRELQKTRATAQQETEASDVLRSPDSESDSDGE